MTPPLVLALTLLAQEPSPPVATADTAVQAEPGMSPKRLATLAGGGVLAGVGATTALVALAVAAEAELTLDFRSDSTTYDQLTAAHNRGRGALVVAGVGAGLAALGAAVVGAAFVVE